MERYGTIPETGYVVVEIGWEYNDEFYYRGESGGGNPVHVYLDKGAAEAKVAELNKIALSKEYANRNWIEEWNEDDEMKVIQDYFEVVEVGIEHD
jgi:hypothetical protein